MHLIFDGHGLPVIYVGFLSTTDDHLHKTQKNLKGTYKQKKTDMLQPKEKSYIINSS